MAKKKVIVKPIAKSVKAKAKRESTNPSIVFSAQLKKQYAYWEGEGTEGYFSMFNSLEDAVGEGGEGTPIFELTPKFIGKFKKRVELVVDKSL